MSRPVLRAIRFASRANPSVRSPCAAFTRRTMASSAPHASHGAQGSDTPWMIGSALVFGPVLLYLFSPSARNTSHSEQSHADASHHAEPQETAVETPALKDDEGAEASGEEIKDSTEKAFAADSPKDAQEHEEGLAKGEESSAESSEGVPQQESADSTTSDEAAATSEEKPEPETAQPESPATTETGEEVAEQKH